MSQTCRQCDFCRNSSSTFIKQLCSNWLQPSLLVNYTTVKASSLNNPRLTVTIVWEALSHDTSLTVRIKRMRHWKDKLWTCLQLDFLCRWIVSICSAAGASVEKLMESTLHSEAETVPLVFLLQGAMRWRLPHIFSRVRSISSTLPSETVWASLENGLIIKGRGVLTLYLSFSRCWLGNCIYFQAFFLAFFSQIITRLWKGTYPPTPQNTQTCNYK